jgi:hypothetical protein
MSNRDSVESTFCWFYTLLNRILLSRRCWNDGACWIIVDPLVTHAHTLANLTIFLVLSILELLNRAQFCLIMGATTTQYSFLGRWFTRCKRWMMYKVGMYTVNECQNDGCIERAVRVIPKITHRIEIHSWCRSLRASAYVGMSAGKSVSLALSPPSQLSLISILLFCGLFCRDRRRRTRGLSTKRAKPPNALKVTKIRVRVCRYWGGLNKTTSL